MHADHDHGNFAAPTRLNQPASAPDILLCIYRLACLPLIMIAMAGHLAMAGAARYAQLPARRITSAQYEDLVQRCDHIAQGVDALRIQTHLTAQILATAITQAGHGQAVDELTQRRRRGR